MLKYANPMLNLANKRYLEKKLVRVQNTAVRLILRALRSPSIAILVLAFRYYPLSLRRGELTVLALEQPTQITGRDF
ncbi:hypothetical protein PoB_000538900 [Plakobranchus ocellatus]|uniref:Uncharacterized protein n=1 Tax=Plakobranchus ocellatus TaxID=259542 RepID=A0AAV3Y7I3_9GAST|nr:hypothetical protein PoB_000538900 [Plakobranchus ocellatus]